MTPTTEQIPARLTNERGAALIAVLLLLMMMSALGAALGVSGHTETLITRNHQSAVQARAAAEAGLSHASEAVSSYIFMWQAHGHADVNAAVDALLADPTLLEPDIEVGTRIALNGSTTTEYEGFVYDEDDPDRGAVATEVDTDANLANDEDGVATTDNNLTLVIRAVGYAQDDTTVVLEAILAPIPLPGLVANGDLLLEGNPSVEGTDGSVHANGDLEIEGSSDVAGNASATGTVECDSPCGVDGVEISGAPEIRVPAIKASDYFHYADYVLTSKGQVTNKNGTVLCDASAKAANCRSVYGWDFAGAAGWAIGSHNVPQNLGTFYVQGDADVSKNLTGPTLLTVISEGSIKVASTPDIAPHTTELLFVADGDVKITGGIEVPLNAQGQILVHGQFELGGNASIAGQVLVENANAGNLITVNRLHGNPTITYNGGLGTSQFSVVGWGEVR